MITKFCNFIHAWTREGYLYIHFVTTSIHFLSSVNIQRDGGAGGTSVEIQMHFPVLQTLAWTMLVSQTDIRWCAIQHSEKHRLIVNIFI